MAAPAKLARFEITKTGQDYSLHIASDAGEAIDLVMTHDELDVLADKLDDILLTDEAADEVTDAD